MAATPTFREALRFWLKLGFVSFGGPTGQIAIMHTELVERKKWIEERRFLHALNFCMLLPGPEATQLATYCGWLLHGTWGGIVAGTLFVLPAAVLLWLLSYIYVAYGAVPWIAAVLAGLKPAVIAIVAAAAIKIGARTLRTPAHGAIAVAAFVGIFFFRVPFPVIVLAAAAAGLLWLRRPAATAAPVALSPAAARDAGSWRRAARIAGVSLLLWWGPVVAAGLGQGWDGVLAREGLFFSKAAMVTFGGAYAVLPYVGQQAVERYGWLSASQMVDGLGLAETTPGPLIMVVQFVGFLGGWHHPGTLPPLAMATLGALITTWTTFVPCFLWILLGAPQVERMQGHAGWTAALGAVTAAVVGVVLNLAVWFGWQVYVPRPGEGVDGYALAVSVLAFVALQRLQLSVVTVVLACGGLGLLWSWVR